MSTFDGQKAAGVTDRQEKETERCVYGKVGEA